MADKGVSEDAIELEEGSFTVCSPPALSPRSCEEVLDWLQWLLRRAQRRHKDQEANSAGEDMKPRRGRPRKAALAIAEQAESGSQVNGAQDIAPAPVGEELLKRLEQGATGESIAREMMGGQNAPP